ncbi:hypothetical protein DICPUDRAFT_24140, partial [Dictyostelium purpureum]
SEDEKGDFEVEKVIDKLEMNGIIHYVIKWKNYSEQFNEAIPESDCNCPELIKEYE